MCDPACEEICRYQRRRCSLNGLYHKAAMPSVTGVMRPMTVRTTQATSHTDELTALNRCTGGAHASLCRLPRTRHDPWEGPRTGVRAATPHHTDERKLINTFVSRRSPLSNACSCATSTVRPAHALTWPRRPLALPLSSANINVPMDHCQSHQPRDACFLAQATLGHRYVSLRIQAITRSHTLTDVYSDTVNL